MQGPFSPVSGPSQPKGPHYCPQTKVFPMGQPSPPVYIVRAPAAPMTGMPHFQTHSFEPRTREKKIIQIKDPNSSKDVTQEILNRQSSGSLTCSTAGSPDSASPDVSGQCNSSSAPPLARQQEAEANVRAQFAVHVASTLASDNEKKPVKPVDYSIMQKAPQRYSWHVTQEKLNRQPSWSFSKNTSGSPGSASPDISEQSSGSSTPPLTHQQQAEANVRAQFAAQVASALSSANEEKPGKPVDYSILQKAPVENTQIPKGGRPQMQFRPQQAMQGEFTPVSGPSQPQGPYGYPKTKAYLMGQPSPPVYIVRAPTAPITGMPHFQTQNFEPRTRQKKIIQIIDPNSNKDVTQKILNRQPSWSFSKNTSGSPSSASPDISGQSSRSSTPPVITSFKPPTQEKKIIQIKDPNSSKDVTQEKLNRQPSWSFSSNTSGSPGSASPDISEQSSGSSTPPVITSFKPPTQEKKIIQIKDPNSSKDVTQEKLNRQPSWSFSSNTSGSPGSASPDISEQSSRSSTPPLTHQQQAEANVRAQFAAQVASALSSANEEKPGKPVDYSILQKAPVENTQIPKGGRHQMQFRPQQAMQGEFTPVSGPSQPQGPYGYPKTKAYLMGQPSSPACIVRAPTAPITGMPHFQTQNFEPRTREKKIIQIIDPNSNKDVTQKILNRQPSWSFSKNTGGSPGSASPDISGQSSRSSTPPVITSFKSRTQEKKIIQIKDPNSSKDVTREILNRQPSWSLSSNTSGSPGSASPNISGQSSRSSTPPLTHQQQAEANVRAQFAAQVASALSSANEEKPCKPVDYSILQKAPVENTQISKGGRLQMQFRPQQAMQGEFTPVSGPSQPQGPYGYPKTKAYLMGQPSSPVYIVRAPATPMTGMPHFQTQNFEPRTRENKIIQIKDPNSNKDVTREILNRQPSWSLSKNTSGSPGSASPDISGQSSRSSTPPLTHQQQAEATVRAQFEAQVASTLASDNEEKPVKPADYRIIQKAPAPQTTKVNPMGQPSPAFVKAPAAPMTGMPHFQTHSFEPRTREKKIIQIKDPNSSKDVTQEILNRQPSWSLTCNTSGSPGSASTDISEQSSRSSTPPLTRQQREETNVRAWLAQFASALSSANEEKPGKPVDYSIIQKAPVENTQIPISVQPQMQYRPRQEMQGPFSPVSGPSQPQGPHDYSPRRKVQPMGQPSSPVFIVKAPAAPMTGMPHFQTHSFEPRTREKKIIQIKDPNSSKDVTQEILNRQPSWSFSSNTSGSPGSASPDISEQSGGSSTPPLTHQQQAEATVRAQFAEQSNNMQMDGNFVQNGAGIKNVVHETDLLEVTGKHMELASQDSAVPAEIIARGPLALESYNKALMEGKTCVKRLPVMFIGQERTGKTSLKKSLKGEAFNAGEDSTDGIEVDPSYFKVSAEIWKTGEKNEEAESESEISFECRAAAQLIFKSLKEEENSMNVSESLVAEDDITSGPDSEEPSSNNTKLCVVAENEGTFQPSEEPNTGSSGSFADQSIAESGLLEETITDSAANSGNDSVTREKREETTRESEVYSSVECKEENYSHLFVPELPEDIATLVKKLLEEDERKEDEEIYSVLWDFGGQSVYYSTHPIFLSAKAIYILVCDLSRDPHAKAKSLVRKGMFKNKEDICCNKTNLDYLDFWLSSVYSLISSDDTHEEGAMSETLPTRLPPVFFVCTHADEPYDCCTHSRDLALEIYGFLQTKAYREHLFKDVFVVDNTKSGGKHECAEVIRLRDEILAVAKELPQMKEEIPLKWLRYETTLQLLCKEQYKWIPRTDAKQLAFEVCRIDDEVEFQTLLNFLHDQRSLIHFNGTPELERMVILDPQWLIDVFKMVITVKRYEHKDRKVEELWRKLEETGILDENLLEHVWSSLFHNQETRESLTAIMERFSLLCPWPSNSESSKQYLVPSMLPSPPTDAVRKLLAAVQIPSLCVKFTSGRVPPGLFPRLILQFFQWCNEVWKSEMMPQLFQNFAMFHILPDQGTAVIFLCHPSFIEVSLHSGDNDIEVTADFKDGSSDVTASRTICSKLRLMLERMRKEFPWLENMSYEMCVRCLVCSRSDTVNYCHTHDMPGCSQEECLHFVSDSELHKCQQFFICTRPGVQGDCRIQVKQFAPYWFGFLDEQENRFSLIQQAAYGDDKGSQFIDEGQGDVIRDDGVHALQTRIVESFTREPHMKKTKKKSSASSPAPSAQCDPWKFYNQRLKVTLLSSEWSSSKGGLSTINREIAILLAKHPRVEVTLLVPQFSCSEEHKKAAISRNVTILEAEKRPGFEDPLDWLISPPRKHVIDVIVGHGAKLGKQAQFVRETHCCKWVQVVHTAPEELSMHKDYPKAISKGEGKNETEIDLCKLANLVMAIGPKLAKIYSSYLRSCKKDILQLTPGIFSEFSVVKQAPEEGGMFKVLTFGRGDPEDFSLKGYDIAAKAIVELQDNSYRLIFVGAPEGKHEDVVQQLLQYGICKNQLVVRTFVQSKDKLKDLLCEVDLAIMPSRTEGFGLTALEALSAGLPILVSGNSGFGEALQAIPCGRSFVVDSEDCKEWAKAISVVRQKNRAQRLQEIQTLQVCYEEKYSWEKQGEGLVDKMWHMVHGN